MRKLIVKLKKKQNILSEKIVVNLILDINKEI